MNAVAQFLILAAIDVAGLFAIYFMLRARVGRQLELESLLSGVREEARALVTELNETADRNVSLVEDRMTSLRELLDEADRRIGVVKRELGSRAAEREVYARLNKRRPIVPAGEDPAAIPAPASAFRPESPVQEAALRAPEAPRIPVESPLAEELPEILLSRERIDAAKSPRERALELHRSGISTDLIAAKVGATVAEIELMIEMEEMRPASR